MSTPYIIATIYILGAVALGIMSRQLRIQPPAEPAARLVVGLFMTFLLYRALLEAWWPELREDLFIRATVGIFVFLVVCWATFLAWKGRQLPLSRQMDELGHVKPISDKTKELFAEAVARRDIHDAAQRITADNMRQGLAARRKERGVER